MVDKYTEKLSFTITPSRRIVANILAFCVATKQFVVLEGKAGIGKSKIIDLI